MRITLLIFCVFSLCAVTNACGRGSVSIENNGYRNILIAIADEVEEDEALIDRIKAAFTQASELLYKATRQRAFFEQITILVPMSWQGQYDLAGDETFDKSDIVVELPDKTDQPFTIKTTPCGEFGYYTRFTTAFLTDETVAEQYGPYDKVILHEWAHLRFGVFDEYPLEYTDNHFYAGRSGEIEATRCSLQLEGEMYNPVTGEDCEYEGNLPESDCRFLDSIPIDTGYGSYMYKTFLDHISEFCDNNTDFPKALHNREAPTLQNKMCGRKSVWEVLRSHPDFLENNPPRLINNTDPSFRVVKPQSLRSVLVLDVSGSMDGCKIEILGQGCSNYISNIIQDNEWLGIVWFNADADKRSALTQINDQTRQDLLNEIPTVASGGTSIGAGIRAALELLDDHNSEEKGGFLIVVSDGEETEPPNVAQVAPEVIAAEATVHSIAITDNADSAVDELARATGGLSFVFSDCNSNAINEAFLAIGELNTSPTNRSYVLSSEVHSISSTRPYSGSTLIDNTLGRNTQFIFDYDSADITPEVTSPSGTVYKKDNTDVVVHDTEFRVYRFTIPQSQFESGTWNYTVEAISGTVRVAITVKSQSANVGEYPVLATVSWGQRTLLAIGGNDNPKLPVYASVSQGYSPVLNADVRVQVETPAGNTYGVLVLDNGAGADAVAGDGIYSTFYTYFDSEGRYGIQVIVNSNAATMVSPERIIGGGVVQRIHPERMNDLPVDPFTRSVTGESFELLSFTDPGGDGKFYPPGDITDLKVMSSSFVDQTAVLSWTAVGAQLDQGQASYYDLRIGLDFDVMEAEFVNQTRVTDSMIVSGTNLSSPGEAGTGETVTVYMPTKGEVTYYFAVVAVDTRTQDVSGAVSNIASVSMKDFTEESSGLTGGEIAGIVIGSLLAVAILVALIGMVVRKQGSSGGGGSASYENGSYDMKSA